MPKPDSLPAAVAGSWAGPVAALVDAEWLMAFAASLGDPAPAELDTGRPEGPLAHPLFPVCYEWPVALALRTRTVPAPLALRVVHASHDLALHRLPRAGDRLATTARVVRVIARLSGALVLTRFDTVDAEGRPVTSTEHGALYRGVEAGAAATSDPGEPGAGPWPVAAAGPAAAPGRSTLTVPAGLAHVYSACSGIRNPIHTDRQVARAAGLPGPILHGTATLALAVSALLRETGPETALGVRRIAARFGAPVSLPSALTLTSTAAMVADGQRLITFEARTGDGGLALRDGRLLLARS